MHEVGGSPHGERIAMPAVASRAVIPSHAHPEVAVAAIHDGALASREEPAELAAAWPTEAAELAAPAASAEPSDLAIADLVAPVRRRGWSLAFDVGVPDGATTAVIVPLRPSVEVSAGMSYNGISPGVRVGVAWKPIRRWLTPTLSVDVGHYFDGDANPLVRLVTENPNFSSAVLDRVGYDYVDAHAGVELGRRALRFFIRAGVTRVAGTIHVVGTMTSGAMPAPFGGSDPDVTITAVSARIGMVLHFGR
jgi:hypothetical protein